MNHFLMGAFHSTAQCLRRTNLLKDVKNFALLHILRKNINLDFSHVSRFKKNTLTICSGTLEQRQSAGAH